jgi:hypothetical protein
VIDLSACVHLRKRTQYGTAASQPVSGLAAVVGVGFDEPGSELPSERDCTTRTAPSATAAPVTAVASQRNTRRVLGFLLI